MTSVRATSGNPGRRGWGLVALLAPNLALGAWLFLVPDRVAFTAAQVATLAHVAIGLLSLPLFGAWLVRHARGRLLSRGATRSRRAPTLARGALATATAAAFATGLLVLWSGEGTAPGRVHAALGIAVALPLVVHLALEGRRTASVLVACASALVVAGSFAGRALIPAEPVEPRAPGFTYALRPLELYDSPSWCGECHTAIYDEWRRSTHGRALLIDKVRSEFARLAPKGIVDSDLAAMEARGDPSICARCHAPLTFFGDDPSPVLSESTRAREGIPCAFCHTLRGMRPSRSVEQATHVLLHGTVGAPYYLSAPETVRRYLGQGARSPFLRRLGNLLIRWRPEMHRRDYHPPFLDGARACEGCHGGTPGTPFTAWRDSPFNSPDRSRRALCQDCHMTRHMTGGPVVEPGRLVPWGAVRPQRRSHLWLGGNARSAPPGDQKMIELERSLSHRGASVRIVSSTVEGGRVRAEVVVKNELVGHDFPNMETDQRVAWVRLTALAADGSTLAETGIPDDRDYAKSDSVVLYRRFVTAKDPASRDEPPIAADTTVPAGGERRFEMSLALPPGARVSRLRADLSITFDYQQPIATATAVPSSEARPAAATAGPPLEPP